MAAPQIENGYLKIANEIAEALYRTNLSPYEGRILWYVFRATYGYSKKSAPLSLSQIATETHLDRRNVGKAMKRLIERNIIASTIVGKRPQYSFQKDYDTWKSVYVDTQKKCVRRYTVSNKKPVPKSVQKTPATDVPFLEILDAWATILPELKKPKPLLERKKKLITRWVADEKRQNVAWWEGLFRYIRKCPHLMGHNDRGWTASFDFVIRSEMQLAKIIEGQYEW